MKNPDDFEVDDAAVITVRPRPKTAVEFTFPTDALRSLDEVAARQGRSREAQIRFYISQGLREHLSQLYAERLLENTAAVLARHHLPSEEVEEIVNEIRRETVTAGR